MQGFKLWVSAMTEQCGWQVGLEMLTVCNKEISYFNIRNFACWDCDQDTNTKSLLVEPGD